MAFHNVILRKNSFNHIVLVHNYEGNLYFHTMSPRPRIKRGINSATRHSQEIASLSLAMTALFKNGS